MKLRRQNKGYTLNINARYSCSRVGCVGWLVEQEALSEGVGHAQAYI